jgi:hypothetical protein
MNLSVNIVYARLIHITTQSFVYSYIFLQDNIRRSLKYNTDNVVALLYFSS